MKKLNLLFLLLSIGLSACSADNETISQAVSGTLTAISTNDTLGDNPEVTETVIPTIIPTQTITTTPSPSPTPDIRIIDTDPQNFLLKQEELPIEGKYYLPASTWMSIHTNEEVISNWTVKKGRDYVTSTGRVVGWWVVRKRGTRAVRMPDEAECSVVLYKTAEGAKLTLSKYNTAEENILDGVRYVKGKNLDIGDGNIIYIKQKIAPGGEKNTWYGIEFVYRNIYVRVQGYAYDELDVSHEFVEDMARKILEKLENAPLVYPEEAILAR